MRWSAAFLALILWTGGSTSGMTVFAVGHPDQPLDLVLAASAWRLAQVAPLAPPVVARGLDLQHGYLVASADLMALRGTAPTVDSALEFAEMGLALRRTEAAELGGALETLETASMNVATAGAVFAVGDAGLLPAVESAGVGAIRQAALAGIFLGQPSPLEGGVGDVASEAEHIVALFGAHPTTASSETIAKLAALPPIVQASLAEVFHAFASFHAAAREFGLEMSAASAQEAEATAWLAALRAERGDAGRLASAPSLPAPASLGLLLEARASFVASAVDLHAVLEGGVEAPSPSFVDMCPAFALDLAGTPQTYIADCALIVDAGGDDTYLNNAGGSNLQGGDCEMTTAGAAALLDFAGNDSYTSGRNCGANGGGFVGAGLLLDAEGRDTYVAGSRGVNGGAVLGSGFLVDGDGDDTYFVVRDGGNGGATLGGSGLLVDGGGDDAYQGEGSGLQGGANLGANGFMADLGGHDTYIASFSGDSSNGGGLVGDGFLLDRSGDDLYDVAGNGNPADGTNGGGRVGTGFLLDGAGNDVYVTSIQSHGSNGGGNGQFQGEQTGLGILLDVSGDDLFDAGTGFGSNGAGAHGGLGFLIDTAGNDTYDAGGLGANGGGAELGAGFLLDVDGADFYKAGGLGLNGGAARGGRGFLLDLQGDDVYEGVADGANGGATGLGDTAGIVRPTVGFLVDAAGNDEYVVDGFGFFVGGLRGGNGGGHLLGAGFLADLGGDDSYQALTDGVNGGASSGAGFLFDAMGDDSYDADTRGVNGGVVGTRICPLNEPPCINLPGGFGLLLDANGSDTYDDQDGGAGSDCSVVPKGLLGLQLDAPPTAPCAGADLPGKEAASRVRQRNEELARALLEASREGPSALATLAAARQAVQGRTATAQELLGGGYGGLMERERDHLGTAAEVLAAFEDAPSSLSAAARAAHAVAHAAPAGPSSPPPHLAEAVQALLGASPRGESEPATLAALADLEPAYRDALAGVLARFSDFAAASRQTFGGLEAPRGLGPWVTRLPGAPPTPEQMASLSQGAHQLEGVDLSDVEHTRADLLEAVLQLSEAPRPRAPPPPMDLCPALALDLVGVDNVYGTDCALIIDVGGDDVYLNNAGGSNLMNGTCDLPGTGGAAALVDLAGDDRYGPEQFFFGRLCGANGGGFVGAGFLLDAAGNDTYRAAAFGVNGGADIGAGFLLDGSGDDVYEASGFGVHGGGRRGGSALAVDGSGNDTWFAFVGNGVNGGGDRGDGALVDGGGADAYTSQAAPTCIEHPLFGSLTGACGANGGGSLGTGFLVDAGTGDDSYVATLIGVNGGAMGGVGFLLDEGGNEHYVSFGHGGNGAGFNQGVGMLVDGDGQDLYESLGLFGNGQGEAGVGMLLDGGGDDVYVGDEAANGGARVGAGLLFDRGGNDTYSTECCSANGGAAAGLGFLLDGGGDDAYLVDHQGIPEVFDGPQAVNGGGLLLGHGFLMDVAGNDTYRAGDFGTNGGASQVGSGTLLDLAGDDLYEAGTRGANGAAAADELCVQAGPCIPLPVSQGLLADFGGSDEYFDMDGGTGTDCSVVPKGLVGAQLDLPTITPCGAAVSVLATPFPCIAETPPCTLVLRRD